MVQFQLNQTINIVRLFMYIAFLCLGIYFIYEGNVVQRFQMKRTNFAESNERINELPTILAEIEYRYPYPDTLMIYGTDFNISYQAVGSEEKIDKQINLTLGENTLNNSELIINFEQQSEYAKDIKSRKRQASFCL